MTVLKVSRQLQVTIIIRLKSTGKTYCNSGPQVKLLLIPIYTSQLFKACKRPFLFSFTNQTKTHTQSTTTCLEKEKEAEERASQPSRPPGPPALGFSSPSAVSRASCARAATLLVSEVVPPCTSLPSWST